MLSLSVCLNALSLHGTCTAVFVAVSAVAAALIASIQTLGKIKFIGWAGVISIFAAREWISGVSRGLLNFSSRPCHCLWCPGPTG